MDKAAFFFYSGIAAATYTLISGLAYYTFSGPQLITSAKAKKLVAEGASVIDVRTSTEFKTGHFPGAIHMPVSKMPTNPKRIPRKLFSGPVVVYCNTGQRARYAAEQLQSLGLKDVYYIAGTYRSL